MNEYLLKEGTMKESITLIHQVLCCQFNGPLSLKSVHYTKMKKVNMPLLEVHLYYCNLNLHANDNFIKFVKYDMFIKHLILLLY